MPTYIIYTCQNCGKEYRRQKGNYPGKYCSRSCGIKANKPSKALIIPDGQPMSARTLHRRRKAAGLVKVIEHEPFNQSFFDTWSDNMAWLLGLIWSDGCLYGTTVEISSKDLQLIELVMALIQGGTYNLKNNGAHIRVHFSSPHTAQRLKELGLTERKSLTVAWPQIDPQYEGAFVRGLIDGDGSVLLRQKRLNQFAPDLVVQLVTASPFLRDGIASWLERNQLRYSLSVRNNTNPRHSILYKFTVIEQASCRTLYTLLYPDDDAVCLHRKRIPFDVWMQSPRRNSS